MKKSCVNITYVRAGVSELADEADSKSVDGNIVWVQVPSPAVSRDNKENIIPENPDFIGGFVVSEGGFSRIIIVDEKENDRYTVKEMSE